MKKIILYILVLFLSGCTSNNKVNFKEDIEASFIELNTTDPLSSGLKKIKGKLLTLDNFKLAILDVNKNNKFGEIGQDAIQIFARNENSFNLNA